MGTEGNYTVDIMRVTERDGNRTDGLYACLECTRLPFELQKEADRLVAILNAAPSPAEPVKVLGGEHTPLPWVANPDHDKRHRVIPIMAATGYNRKAIEDGEDQSVLVASCADHHVTRATAEANAAFIVLSCNSHAAHLAKIAALAEALKANMDTIEAHTEWFKSMWPESEKEECARLDRNLESARAALA